MKAIKIIGNILLTLLVFAALIVTVPQFFGVKYLSVLSGSMEPDVPVGSLVVCTPVADQDIKIGDIVSYVADENLTVVTHRVVSVELAERTVTTKGDANDATDAPVLMANVAGVSNLHIPYLGYVAAYLSTVAGKIVALSALVAVVLIVALVQLVAHRSKQQIIITYKDTSDLDDETLLKIGEQVRLRSEGQS